MADSQNSMEAIEARARTDSNRTEKLLHLAQAAQTIVIPALIAFLAWFRQEILAVDRTLFVCLLGALVVLQLILWRIQASSKQSVQDLYFHAKDLQARVLASEEQNKSLLSRAELFIFTEKFAETCAKTLLLYRSQTVKSQEEFNRVVGNILEPLVSNGEQIFGFGPDEKWNFVVYIYDSGQDSLIALWREKSRTHPSDTRGRAWKRGQGHVGFAFANSRAVITEDSSGPDVRNLVSATEGHARDYDERTYVSFASIPIGPVDDAADPLGVLVATSDRVGRFTSENSRVLVHAAIAIANVLSVARSDLSALVRTQENRNGQRDAS